METMKIAVAGTGNLAQYLIEEFTAAGHLVIVLTRKAKPEPASVERRQTDYSTSSLINALEDCDALVSTVADFENPPAATKVHLDMLEACRQSTRCKTFIPSEWTLNVEDYPEQPVFLTEANRVLHQALKQATGVKWTIICNGWFADYIVPSQQRYLRDVGAIFPVDLSSKTFTIYGPGTQLVDFTSARDVAKATAVLLKSGEPWEEYTYLSGEQLSWNHLFAILQKRDPAWTSKRKPLADSIRLIADKESSESLYIGYFEIQSYSGALTLPREKVQRHRAKYFGNVHFRTIEEILDAATAQPDAIV